MEVLVVVIGAPALLGEGDQDDAAVFLAALPLYISFFDQSVDGDGQRAYRYAHSSGNGRHVARGPDSDGLDNVHIVVRNVTEFICYDSLFFYIHNLVK